MPIVRSGLILPYSDLAERQRTIDVVALEEILGNKWHMLDDRKEPRDLYDVWAALFRFDVSFDRIVEGLEAKYGALRGTWRLERVKSLADRWELRLSNQVADLPTFEDVFEAIGRKIEEWERRSRG